MTPLGAHQAGCSIGKTGFGQGHHDEYLELHVWSIGSGIAKDVFAARSIYKPGATRSRSRLLAHRETGNVPVRKDIRQIAPRRATALARKNRPKSPPNTVFGCCPVRHGGVRVVRSTNDMTISVL